MSDIYIDESCGGGINFYRVMVDGEPYDSFTSTRPLTFSEQADVVAGYREGLGR